VWTGQNVLVWGGDTGIGGRGDAPQNDGARYTPPGAVSVGDGTDFEEPLPQAPAPQSRPIGNKR
jgi:hypothetical protein